MIHLTDLADISVSPTTQTAEVLAGLNRSPYLFFVVVDETGRLLGTITDGDVRRAILGGATLDDPASHCMYKNAIVGSKGDEKNNMRLLANVPFLPIVDAERRVVEVIIPTPKSSGIATALIMAGGRGTRLGQRTKNTPKPMLPIGDKPILEHILRDLEAVGIGSIYVAVHHLASQIKSFLETYESSVDVSVIHEQNMLGTAGAIGLLPEQPSRPILVVNGDLMTGTDFRALDSFHWRHGHDATIGVAQYETEVPYGVVKHDGNGIFLGIDEKPLLRHFVAAGIYYLAPEFVSLVPQNEPIDMPDLLNRGREVGLRIGLFPIHEYWRDVGRPHDLEAAKREHGHKSTEDH